MHPAIFGASSRPGATAGQLGLGVCMAHWTLRYMHVAVHAKHTTAKHTLTARWPFQIAHVRSTIMLWPSVMPIASEKQR